MNVLYSFSRLSINFVRLILNTFEVDWIFFLCVQIHIQCAICRCQPIENEIHWAICRLVGWTNGRLRGWCMCPFVSFFFKFHSSTINCLGNRNDWWVGVEKHLFWSESILVKYFILLCTWDADTWKSLSSYCYFMGLEPVLICLLFVLFLFLSRLVHFFFYLFFTFSHSLVHSVAISTVSIS